MRLLSRGDDEAVGKCARQRLSPSDEREGKKIRRRMDIFRYPVRAKICMRA